MKYKLLFQSFEIMNLLLNKNVPVGGAAVEWYNWMKGFRKIGCDFGILTWEGANNAINNKEFDYDIVESYHVEKGIPKIRLFTYRIPMFYNAVKKYNPHFVIQGCALINTGIFAFIAKRLGKPFIHRIGSDMDVDGRISRTFSKFSLAVYNYGIRNASHISCQNKYQFNILKKKYPNKSISVLYNPFEIKNEYEIEPKEYIAWIGNFRYEKNLPALADIAKILPQYKIKIAGTKFDKIDEDTNRGLNELEKLKNVKFIGHIDNSEILQYLNKAYCLLNTSRLEGFPNTFLEAWSTGTPVISTKNVNPDNIITDYNLGFVANNYEELPELLKKMIEENNYLNFYSTCKNYVKEYHDPEKLASKFLNEMINTLGNLKWK